MPRYYRNYRRRYNRLATKAYVKAMVKAPELSSVQVKIMDFEGETLNDATGSIYRPEHFCVVQDIIQKGLFKEGITNVDENGNTEYDIDYKIVYMKLYLRVGLGESEELSAVAQNARVVVYRLDGDGQNPNAVVDDFDAPIRYPRLYGYLNGLWYDRQRYIRSVAADSDTTAGGQTIFKRVIYPKHRNTAHIFNVTYNSSDDEYTADYTLENGSVETQILGEDPSGTNAQVYGYIEVGYKYYSNQ